jgi:PAS domain S-box-containing protein
MPSTAYSFIDVAVLEPVRERFAAGDAVVILSTDLAELLWANGPGAALFGHADIEAIVGADSGLSFAARRQIMATRGYPEIGRDRTVAVRLSGGAAVMFSASAVTLPDGEAAIMLAMREPAERSAKAAAEQAISGFTNPGHLAAVLDEAGSVEAASQGFAALDIAPPVLAGLVAEVAGEADRLVKKIIPAGTGGLPAGIARLGGRPARHLLVVVAEAQAADAGAPEVARDGPTDHQPTVDITETGAGAPTSTQQVEPAAEPLEVFAQPADEAGPTALPAHGGTGDPDDGATAAAPATPDAEPDEMEADEAEPAASFGETPAETPASGTVPGEAAPADEAAAAAAAAETEETHEAEESVESGAAAAEAGDRGTEADSAGAVAPEGPPPPAQVIDRTAPPIRFAWKTDAAGRFSAVSAEFLAAVGMAADAVIGRSFADVSATLGIDPDREIAGLLERRDTWSGRSIQWPVAGAELRLPVDLAALPVYSRDRSFEGFRGFGIARVADMVADESRTETAASDAEALDAGAAPAEHDAEEPSAAEPGAEEEAADPFRGEVPALTIVPKPDRRSSDKIIRLAEHRPPAGERSLSTVERSAFREIGEKLRKAGGLENGDEAKAASGTDAAEAPHGEAPHEGDADPAFDASEIESEPEADSADAPAGGGAVTAVDEDGAEAAEPTILPAPSAAEAGTDRPSEETGLHAAVATEDGEHADAFASGLELQPAPTEAPVSSPDRSEGGPIHAAATADLTMRDADPQRDAEIHTISVEPGDGPAAAESPQPAVEPAFQTEPAQPAADTISPAAGDGGPAPVSAEETQAAATSTEPETTRTEPDLTIEVQEKTEPAGVTPVAAARAAIAELKTNGLGPSVAAGAPLQDTPILSRLPVPLLIHSGDALHYANDEFLTLTGFASLEALTEAGGLDALFVDPYGEEAQDDVDRALRLKTADGTVFPIEALLRSVPWSGRRALMLVVRRTGEMEEAAAATDTPNVEMLRARVAEMRAIIDTATDGVILITNEGAIRSISRPAEALFGIDSDEISGKAFVSLFAIESQRAARDYLAGLSDHGVASVLNDGREVIGREAQGRFIPLFMTIGKLPGDSGYCAVVRDITQWKRAEEELTQARSLAERASSQKSDFLARISHEIRTPLNAIIGFSELMIDERFGAIGNDRYRDYLIDINRSGNHVLDLVNDLLDISKIEAGQQEMAHEAVSLNEALAQTVAMMQPQANRERVIIRSSFASRLPDVVADSRSVRQIALNLLSNAVRYTQAGGQVIVSTAYEPSGDVVMRVRDTGIGMTQAEIEQALKPFKQINALKRSRGDGTGLGLPLTKAMVEANRARFAINSTPGEGTLVEVTFPSTRVLAT